MPRSHICPSCLTELARIRAVPEPHYRLPIVVCPGCSLACVRTKHPDQAFWRGIRRGVRSGWLVILKGLLLGVMSLVVIFVLGSTINALERADPSTPGLMILPSPLLFDPYGLIPSALLAIGAGCAIRLGFGHLRVWGSLCVLFGAIALIVVSVLVAGAIATVEMKLAGGTSTGSSWEREDLGTLMAGIPIVVSVVALGVFPAELILAHAKKRAHRRFRKIRRQYIRKQTRAD